MQQAVKMVESSSRHQVDYVTTPREQSQISGLCQSHIFLVGERRYIYIALWYLAHRCAFDRGAEFLTEEDFARASNTYMAPLRPAINALLSNKPDMLSVYEDLLPRDDLFWANLFATHE